MIYHPVYKDLEIRRGSTVGEPAVGGAFFETRAGVYLSHIVKSAWGDGTLAAVQLLNLSAWNRANCVYRKNSGNCTSEVTTLGQGGYIALCPGDTQDWARQLGLIYPVVWVPPRDTLAEPDALSQYGKTSSLAPGIPKPEAPGFVLAPGIPKPEAPDFVVVPPGNEAPSTKSPGGKTPAETPVAAKVPIWMWALTGLTAVVGVVMAGVGMTKK